MILLIDNYDSFVYNLVQRIGELGWESMVYRNDEITPEEFPLPVEIPAEEEVEEQVISPIEPMDIYIEPSEAAPLEVVEHEEAPPEPLDVLPEPTEVAPLEVVEDEEAHPEPLDILPDPTEVAPPAVPSDVELPSEVEGEVEEVDARVDEYEGSIMVSSGPLGEITGNVGTNVEVAFEVKIKVIMINQRPR